MVEIVEITEETCGDCEDFEIERTWRSLKHEDAAQTVKALTIFRAVPTIVLAAPMPSPVRRNAEATPQNSPQTSRLVRYAKRQQERSDARRNAVNARRAAGEASHEQLALLESMLGKVGLMATK